ncbi:hypothetical protein B0I35DRAFT_408907 [Stachybotrys elegans]|uniref:Uncharacterized protein n=1 Tax=Stachybotrys elegans TaxID=80388 RepID=A0A8K0SX81_9HYPO|nr:hypothetical protein B0I35DRAFT_408907 [Stachybotrys elegans]
MVNQHAMIRRSLLRFLRRRATLILVIFALCAIILTSTSAAAAAAAASARITYAPKISVPGIGSSFLNPFRQPSHPPPRQKDDSYGGSSWWADWKWLSVPFSSSLTLDHDRTILPPLSERPPIYCYYDTAAKKSRQEKEAESRLLLTWRRAWWANGFRPVIINDAEAVNNPLYPEIQKLELHAELKADLMRWLAWETVGGGLLSHYTLLPIPSAQEPLPVYIRRGDYPRLVRWEGLDDSLIAGKATDIGLLLQSITQSPLPTDVKNTVSAVGQAIFQVDAAPASLAYYSPPILEKKYSKVASLLSKERASGLDSLDALINAHLHLAWQNRFPEGIEVLKPFPDHATAMVNPALDLAKRLVACSETPMPSSCPPNLPECSPCVGKSRQMGITTPTWYHNSTKLFAIGTVPHPWTLALVNNLRDSIDVGWIVRESPRDPWLRVVTQWTLGTGVGGARRVMRLKEAVAGPETSSMGIWCTAEAGLPKDVDWLVGFEIPREPVDYGDSLSPVPADRLVKDEDAQKVDRIQEKMEKQAAEQAPLLELAKKVVLETRATAETKVRSSLEAWSMADTEAWRFVRAYRARCEMEREKWETEEAKYVGGAGSESGRSAWSRWQDRMTR